MEDGKFYTFENVPSIMAYWILIIQVIAHKNKTSFDFYILINSCMFGDDHILPIWSPFYILL